ncbi:hypothetical protein ACET3Z_002910 [Daucus carota]
MLHIHAYSFIESYIFAVGVSTLLNWGIFFKEIILGLALGIHKLLNWQSQAYWCNFCKLGVCLSDVQKYLLKQEKFRLQS